MNSLGFTLCAVMIYAFMNVAIEQRLASYTPAVVMAYASGTILAMSLGRIALARMLGETVSAPSMGIPMAWMAGIAVAYFFSDYCYFSAYAAGGTVARIASVSILIPIAASFMKYAWVGAVPKSLEALAGALAIAAVGLFAYANWTD